MLHISQMYLKYSHKAVNLFDKKYLTSADTDGNRVSDVSPGIQHCKPTKSFIK
jgi:hypothetical protein